MSTAVLQPATPTRCQQLMTATDDLHEHLHGVVAAAEAFADTARYARWLAVQFRFQQEIEPLYALESLQRWLPGLANRGRLAAVAADLADLGTESPAAAAERIPAEDLPTALGWLFVSEGSTLGAAVLLKKAEAQLGLSAAFGARHLAAAPAGRATHWKQFVQALDALELDAADERRLHEAARAAFRRFDVLLQDGFRPA